jgi:hypothetical protein
MSIQAMSLVLDQSQMAKKSQQRSGGQTTGNIKDFSRIHGISIGLFGRKYKDCKS